jgi:hypothetical protein
MQIPGYIEMPVSYNLHALRRLISGGEKRPLYVLASESD